MSCYLPNISVSGLAVFNNNSENYGVIRNGLFKNSSENYGLVTSTAYFSESALNMECGSVGVSAIFTDYSTNRGEVNIGVFLENSTNTGYVTTAIFDESVPEPQRGTYINFLPFTFFKRYNDGDYDIYRYQNYFGEDVSYEGNNSTLIYKNTAGDLYTGFYSSNYYLSGTILTNTEVPVILVSPENQVAYDESTVTFSVSARGTGDLYYQWFREETLIYGATSRNLEFKVYYDGLVGGEYSTSYRVTVANDLGYVKSPLRSLVVRPNGPQILSQTNSLSAQDGSVLFLSAGVSGTQPLNYQWYIGGIPIEGANDSSYIINGLNYWNFPTQSTGYYLNRPIYTLKVSNMVGDIYSERINVYPTQRPIGISSVNSPVSAEDGDMISISMNLTGTFPVILTIYKNGVFFNDAIGELDTTLLEYSGTLIEPRSSPTITLNVPIQYNLTDSVTSSNVSAFKIVASNDVGEVSSTNILVSAFYKPITEINGPVNISMNSGTIPSSQRRRLTVVGTVTSTEWYYNGSLVNDNDLIYDRILTYANNGDTFYAIVRGLTNSLTSREATVSVTPATKPAIITQPPSSIEVRDGQLATFSVSATPSYLSGGDLVNYQWYVKTENTLAGFTLISAATSRDYSFYPTYFNNNYLYRVRLSNPRGFTESSVASLYVSAASAVITQQPVSASISSGQVYSYSTSAVGLMPLGYTWFKNGSAVQTSTAASLTGVGYLIDNNSTFYVSVSNVSGIAISNEVILRVI
jgi:hypothetical protein